MANASAKRIAGQNERTVKYLKLGLFFPTLVSFLFRFLLRGTLPSKGSIIVYIATFLPAFFLSNYLIKIGQPRRDPVTNSLISYGEDLSQPGVTEWCFDILYVTWTCQIGSGAFGEWFWWLYMAIPLYATYKLWTSVIGPMFAGRGSTENSENEQAAAGSKKQEKLRRRQDKGDPRVKVQSVKK